MPKYYIKYDSIMSDGRVFWLGSNNQWVDQQCNAVVHNTIDSAKVVLASVTDYTISNRYMIVQEKVTFDVVLSGDQLISVKLNNLADKAWGYTHDHIAHEIRKIAKEIKQ
ncbi:MAG: hypothetical protein ACK528_10230 [Alphaproteobacteria bacterium]|jgi:hypothetical protein